MENPPRSKVRPTFPENKNRNKIIETHPGAKLKRDASYCEFSKTLIVRVSFHVCLLLLIFAGDGVVCVYYSEGWKFRR